MEKVYSNSAEDIDAVIDTNVKGMLYMIREVVPGMVERDKPALVINIGSVAGDAHMQVEQYIVLLKQL